MINFVLRDKFSFMIILADKLYQHECRINEYKKHQSNITYIED